MTPNQGYSVIQRLIFRISLPILLLTLFAGCRNEVKQKKFRIGFSQCCRDPWRAVMESEMLRELSFYPDIEFEIKVADGNSKTQVAQIKELVASGVDLLIVAPNESKPLTAIVEETFRKNIPVILIDRKTESNKFTAYIGADNYKIGQTAAQYIGDQKGGKGKIIELQLPLSISAATERHRGFIAGLKAFPEMEIVATYETHALDEDEKTKLPEVFKQHPEADIVYGHTDLLSEIAWRVSQKINPSKDLFLVGIDGIPGTGNGIQAVEDSILDASLLYPTGGSESIKLAFSILNRLPFEKNNRLQTTVIYPGNAAILHAQMKKEALLQESIDKQIVTLTELKTIYRDQRVYIIILISSLLLAMLLGVFLWQSLRAKQAINENLELKNMEVLEHEKQLIAISDELQLATQAKVDFFTNISHEFRTPLTLILGFVEDLLIFSKSMGNDVQQSVGFIHQNAYRLLRLVNQLMDFRKIESERMRLQCSEIDLTEFVKTTMKSFSKVAEKRTIDLKFFARHEHLSIWFDPAMMDKVLFNLLSNAFKFTPDGGKVHITIQVDSFENVAKINVEDSGVGMSEEESRHVFEAFYQGVDGLKAGTGLGLSLSRALVELHHGTLTVSSMKNVGSRFAITLPLGKNHLREDQLATDSTSYFQSEEFLFEPIEEMDEPAENLSFNPEVPRILIIEDNPELQFFLKRKLGEKYRISSARSGDKGLQLAFDSIPDLLICDVMLPDIKGLDIVQTLKSDLRTSHIPIIILSARTTVEQQIEGSQTGADSYVTKPFNVHYLEEKIRNLLHNRQILKETFGSVIHSYSDQSLENPVQINDSLNQLDRAFTRKFAAYVDANFNRPDFQVTNLCEEMNLSRSQLYRKVKALYGETITDYVQKVRLEKARELLLEGNLTVAEIAYEVGYSSPDYFSTVFKSKFNMAPTQLKKQQG